MLYTMRQHNNRARWPTPLHPATCHFIDNHHLAVVFSRFAACQAEAAPLPPFFLWELPFLF